jgi:hypothetical protein
MISSATEVREHYAWGAAFLVIALWQRRTIPRIRALSIAWHRTSATLRLFIARSAQPTRAEHSASFWWRRSGSLEYVT